MDNLLTFLDIFPDSDSFIDSMPITNAEMQEFIYFVLSWNNRYTLYEDKSLALDGFIRVFVNNYMKLLELWKLYDEFKDSTIDDIKLDSKETYEQHGNETGQANAFVKTAQTPTAVNPSTTYIDSYSDTQSKQSNDNSVTRNNNEIRKNERNFYERYLELVTRLPNVPQQILTIFNPLYVNFII